MSYYIRIIILIVSLTFAVSFGNANGAVKNSHPDTISIQHSTTDPVALALELGNKFWSPLTPCNNQIKIKSRILSYSPTSQSGVAAQGLANGTLEPAMRSEWNETIFQKTECEIIVNYKVWPNWLSMDRTFQWFCDSITHELGHFLGLSDDEATNPAWINYPILDPNTPNYNSVPQCINNKLWYGNRATTEINN